MTHSTEDALATSVRIWEMTYETDWPELLDAAARLAGTSPGTAFDAYLEVCEATAIVTGSRHAADLAPLVPLLDRDLGELERVAAAGQVSWAMQPIVDLVGAFAAMGAPGADALVPRAARCLPSIRTSRDDDHVMHHWNRGLAALALDVPAIYRPISGHELRAPVAFVPGVRFQLNVQGFLAHLAGAVEQRAPLAACEPAWRDLLANFRVLHRANLLSSSSLIWAAWILHHRIAGGTVAGVADYLHASVMAAAGRSPVVDGE